MKKGKQDHVITCARHVLQENRCRRYRSTSASPEGYRWPRTTSGRLTLFQGGQCRPSDQRRCYRHDVVSKWLPQPNKFKHREQKISSVQTALGHSVVIYIDSASSGSVEEKKEPTWFFKETAVERNNSRGSRSLLTGIKSSCSVISPPPSRSSCDDANSIADDILEIRFSRRNFCSREIENERLRESMAVWRGRICGFRFSVCHYRYLVLSVSYTRIMFFILYFPLLTFYSL